MNLTSILIPVIALTSTSNATFHPTAPSSAQAEQSNVASLTPEDIKEYEDQSTAVQQLIARGLLLTRLNLAYKYGSDDPRNGGMDCSGTVHYLLKQSGLTDAPRDSGELYRWVWTKSRFNSVVSSQADTFELAKLKPGDLLFWTGTYHVDRDPPISHVMIYLGTNRNTGHRVMVGASEGRTYEGKPRYGVSVFDFHLPNPAKTAATGSDLQSRFIGYGAIPNLEASSTVAPAPAEDAGTTTPHPTSTKGSL